MQDSARLIEGHCFYTRHGFISLHRAYELKFYGAVVFTDKFVQGGRDAYAFDLRLGVASDLCIYVGGSTVLRTTYSCLCGDYNMCTVHRTLNFAWNKANGMVRSFRWECFQNPKNGERKLQ